jgi:hypothetical protein
MIREMLSWLRNEERFREEILGASADADRAGRPTAQAPAGLGDTATIPLRGRIA